MIDKLIPRLRDILFFCVFIAVLLLGPQMLNQDGDLPRHMAIGRYVLDGNFPPVKDIFSHTVPNTPFAPHKWLSGVIFYIAYFFFDERGMVLVSAISLACTFLLIYSEMLRKSNLALSIFLLLAWGAALTSLHWIVRPHIFTMLLFVYWLILTDRLARGEKVKLWIFPATMLVWNNIHGEFIAGFLITIAYLAGWIWDYFFSNQKPAREIGKKLGLSFVFSIVVTIINPISVMAWGTVTSWLSNDYLMSHTNETLPPDFSQSKFFILLVFIAFSIFLLAISNKNLTTGQAICLAIFTTLVLLSARNIHFYGIAAPFLLTTTFHGITDIPLFNRYESFFHKIEAGRKTILWQLVTIIMGIFLVASTPLGVQERFSPDFFPVKAVEWLQTNTPQGNILNPFDWGGYLSFMLPQTKVFIDSQGDVYGEDFVRQYETVITTSPGWQDILARYNVKWALLPVNWPLVDALQSSDWKIIYSDSTAIILVKD